MDDWQPLRRHAHTHAGEAVGLSEEHDERDRKFGESGRSNQCQKESGKRHIDDCYKPGISRLKVWHLAGSI